MTMDQESQEIFRREESNELMEAKKEFPAFLLAWKNNPLHLNEELLLSDKDNLFAIHSEGSNYVSRNYFAFSFLGNTEEKEIFFYNINEARIFPQEQTVVLIKYGRPGGQSLQKDNAIDKEPSWLGKEWDAFSDAFGKVIGREEESLRIGKTRWGTTVKYNIRNIKGEEGRFAEVNYDWDGNLSTVEADAEWPSDRSMLSKDASKVPWVMADALRQAVSGDLNLNIMDNKYLNVHFDEGVGNQPGVYTIIISDKEYKPLYKMLVPEKVDVEKIVADLSVDELLAKPTQPAKTVQNQVSPDDNWRIADFSQITGIEITPIDIDIPGPGK